MAYGYTSLEGFGAVKAATPYGKGSKPPAVLPPIPSNAHPKFKPELDWLLAKIQEYDLPFRMKQLCRTKEFQCWAKFNEGSMITDPAKGAHPNCLAMDFTLDMSRKGSHPLLSDAKHEYDTGLEKDKNGVKTIIARPHAYNLWKVLGSIVATNPNLEWGGNWFSEPLGKKGDLIGWDAPHVQLAKFTKHIPADIKAQAWLCDEVKGPYRVDAGKDADALKEAQARATQLAEEARDRPFEFAGYGIGTLLAVTGTVAGAYYVYKRLRRR
jgi:hypothetical protein